MRTTPKLRWVNETVGAVALLCIVVALVVVLRASEIHHWLVPLRVFTVVLPEEGTFGLTEGSEVEILGATVGHVARISIHDSGNLNARIEVRRDFAQFLRADSAVVVRKTLGVAGDTFLSISRGTGDPLPPDAPILNVVAETGPSDTMDALLVELRTGVLPLAAELRKGVRAWTRTAELVNDPELGLAPALRTLTALSARLERGDGTIGRLMADEGLADEVTATAGALRAGAEGLLPVVVKASDMMGDARLAARDLAALARSVRGQSEQLESLRHSLQAVLDELQVVLAATSATTVYLPVLVEDLSAAAAEMPALTRQAERTLRELERLSRTAQGSWLLGAGTRPVAEPVRISPQQAMPQ